MYASFRISRSVFVISTIVVILACTAAAFAVNASAANTEIPPNSVKLPVLMYHSMLKEQKRLGKYVVSPDEFEGDLRCLKENGYQTINVQDLLNYVQNGSPLPEKPVMLTFDDGYYNNYTYAYPLAKKYGAKIIIAPVGAYTDQFTKKDSGHPSYSYLTWGQIAEMMSSGLVEFQNHSYNLHTTKGRLGAQKCWGEDFQTYKEILQNDVGKMQAEMEENTGFRPTAFVYPFGALSDCSDSILREMGFQATFTCLEKMNYITRDPNCLFSLGRFLRPSGISSKAYFRKIGLVSD
jgi:peptidoglycan/xylan/chitin deacetylase (PgdA/CDA1 family)